MAYRPQFNPYPVINAQSMASNITGTPTIIQKIPLLSYTAKWTGSSPVGTLKFQVSDDYALNSDGSVANAGTWNDLPVYLQGSGIVTSIPISGNSDNGAVDIKELGFYAVRPVYTATSGTGTLTVTIAGKVE